MPAFLVFAYYLDINTLVMIICEKRRAPQRMHSAHHCGINIRNSPSNSRTAEQSSQLS